MLFLNILALSHYSVKLLGFFFSIITIEYLLVLRLQYDCLTMMNHAITLMLEFCHLKALQMRDASSHYENMESYLLNKDYFLVKAILTQLV